MLWYLHIHRSLCSLTVVFLCFFFGGGYIYDIWSKFVFCIRSRKKKMFVMFAISLENQLRYFFFRTLDNFSSVCGMLSRCSIAKIIFLISRLSVVASDNLLVLGDPPRRINSFPPPNFNRFVKPFSRISSGKK